MPDYAFASDNTAGACPEAMEAIVAANAGFTSGYATDHVTKRAADLVRELLDADADVRFVASGTAANAVSCAALCRPFESVIAHEHAHVCTDETGAPGFFGQGLGLIPLKGASGKIDPAALDAVLDQPDVSYRQSPSALSLTNATEYGTLYTVDEVRGLTGRAKAKGLAVHFDGARLANAAAAGFDLKAIKTLGIDILIVGGAKAGASMSEAIVLFDKGLSRRFDARLKQAGQLPSKGRFVSAPWIGLLEGGAWLERSRHANAMAKTLAGLMPFELRHPQQANALFVDMDDAPLERLRAKGYFVYRFLDGTVRFMCSWATTPEAVEALGAALKEIA